LSPHTEIVFASQQLQVYWLEFLLSGLRWARLDHLPLEGLGIVTAEAAIQVALSVGQDAVNKAIAGGSKVP